MTACTSSAAPTKTPTDLPVAAAATLVPTTTPEPNVIPHPEGWEESWVVVEEYIEKHNGHLEEIDARNYFTTMVTVSIDDQTQQVKGKLLEESEDGVMIPSYKTVQQLLAGFEIRLVLELRRMNNPSEALFVVRVGEDLQEDLLRTNEVSQGLC